MATLDWTETEALAYLGAMKAVALAHEPAELTAIDRAMLRATAEHVLQIDADPDTVATVDAEALAEAVPDAKKRGQALEFLILMPYLQGEVDPHRVAEVDRYAAALGVHRDTLTSLHQVRDDRMKRLQFDYFRRSMHTDLFPGDGMLAKIRTAAEAFHQFRGDAKVAERYAAYASFEKGTLGRTFADFYRDRNFPLPGEKGSFSEFIVPHDLSHILGGFNTDMAGEMDVAGMEAGMAKTPFGYELLLEVILDFHLGLPFTTMGLLKPGKGNFHPDSVMRGFEIGARMSIDLMSGWDWHADMDQPVPRLRERYGIEGVTGIEIPPPVAN